MSSVVISGDTSGAITLSAPAVSGTTTLTLPATTGNVLADTTVGVCRAWVNFQGTGTVAIRAAFNVTSITDGGAGIYTVNFTTAMSDANYAVTVNVRNTNGGDFGNVSFDTDITTSAAKVNSFNAAGASVDVSSCYVTIFR
jgi:hypothetical protein